jgi:hypothetical protein
MVREPTEAELAAAASLASIPSQFNYDEQRKQNQKYYDERAELYRLEATKPHEKTSAEINAENLAETNRRMAYDAANPVPATEKELQEQREIQNLHARQAATRTAQALAFAHAQNLHL